jgi:hypothetical protein
MIFWMIATLTTHHKMAKRKKPWLSYRTTLVPAPRTTACETLGAREDDEDRAWARALATSAFSSILLASFSLRGCRSPPVLAVATWAWLGPARLGWWGKAQAKSILLLLLLPCDCRVILFVHIVAKVAVAFLLNWGEWLVSWFFLPPTTMRMTRNPAFLTTQKESPTDTSVESLQIVYLHVACGRDWCFASLLLSLLLFLSWKEKKGKEREGSSSCRLISNSLFAFSWGCGVWIFRVLRTRKACYKSRLGSTIRNSSGQVLSCGAVNGDLCSTQQVDL